MTHATRRLYCVQAFYDEVSTWRCLRHPHIVPFLGVSDILPSCLVSEWMEYGDIASFFRMRPDENRLSYASQFSFPSLSTSNTNLDPANRYWSVSYSLS